MVRSADRRRWKGVKHERENVDVRACVRWRRARRICNEARERASVSAKARAMMDVWSHARER